MNNRRGRPCTSRELQHNKLVRVAFNDRENMEIRLKAEKAGCIPSQLIRSIYSVCSISGEFKVRKFKIPSRESLHTLNEAGNKLNILIKNTYEYGFTDNNEEALRLALIDLSTVLASIAKQQGLGRR